MTLILFSQSNTVSLESSNNLSRKNQFGVFLLVFTILYMGLRPVSMFFGDMWIYAKEFDEFKYGKIPLYSNDVFFEFLMYSFSKIGGKELFFFVCALLYILPLYSISKKYFKDYWFYSFFILVASFSFWAYGVNGIRNGIATSLFLLAISRKNIILTIIIFLAALNIHSSTLLLIVAYFLTLFIKDSKLYFGFWILTIPLSLALGGFWESFFLSLGFGEETKLQAYLGEFDQVNNATVLKIGFRWDFLIYSATGVFAAWYFIIKCKFQDAVYTDLANMYLFLNGIWILIIRSNFSNRFAYLSWFMLGIIIIYPLLKSKFFENQHAVIGRIIFIYFAFTYLLNVILA